MGEQEQFQQPDPLQKMYGVLTQKGYYTKSFDEFKQKYSQPENIDKLYSVLNRDGLYTKNKDSFYGKYFPALPAKPNGEPKPEAISAPFLINKNTFAIPEGGFKGTQEELLSHVKTSPKINYPDQQAPKESKDPVGDFMAEQNEKKRQSLSRATDNTSIARSLPQQPLTPKVEDVKKTAFQSTDDAADWLSKNKKIELDPALLYQYDRATLHKAAGDNKTSQVAADKVYEAGRLKQAIETSPDLETVAAKYGAAIGEIKDPATVQAIQTGSSTWKGILDDAVKGQLLNTLFHSSDFVNEVKKNPALYQQYKQESVNLMQHYPEFGTGIIASIISQAREDKGKNNWFINVKTQDDTDKMVDELVAEGKLSLMDKTFYQQHRDDVFYKIKSPGIIEEGLGGIRDFADSAVKSYRAAESKGVGLLTGWMGQERNHDSELAAEELSKRSSESGFQPKGVHKFSMIGGQMVGYLLPVGALAKGLTASQLVNNPILANGLSFGMEEFGNVEGRAREYFPNDKTKQFAYTSLLTLLNTSIGGVLPQGKAAEALSKIEPTAVEVLNKFTAGEISSAAAKDLLRTQVQKALVTAGDIAGATMKHNVKAANVMSALEMADRGLVNLFDGQDPHEKMNAGHVFENWLTNAIASTGLSAIAAVPEGSAKRIKAKQLFEMATNYDKYNSILGRQVLLQPELAAEIKDKKQNLQLAAGIVNDIANTELTQAQKEKYLLHSLNEQMLTKKLEGMTDGLLKKQTREQIKKSEEAREKLFEDRKNQLNEQQKAAIDKQFEEIQNEKTKENVTTDQPTGIPTAEAGNKEVEQAGVGETNTGLQTDNGRSGENVGTEIKLEAPVESKAEEAATPVSEGGKVEITAYRYGGDGKDGVTFSSKNRDYSEEYARVKGGKPEDVKEVKITAENPVTVDLPTNEFSDPKAEQKYIDEAKKNGNDLVIFRDKVNGDEFYAQIEKPNSEQVVQGSDTTQVDSSTKADNQNVPEIKETGTEQQASVPKTPHADFREQILSDLENEKGSEFDFVLDELPIQQSGRKTAVKNIRQGKSTKATKMVEEAIQKMYDEGYVYLNRGRGNQSERIAIPLEKYMEEIRRPLEATEADLHELNTLLGDEAFNDTFDRAYEEITKTQNNETKRNGEIAETLATPEGAAEPSVSETKTSKSSSQPDTENTIGSGEGGQPPTTKEQAAEVGGGEGQGIRHADTAETRKEFGLPDYEKKKDTIEAWDAEADQRIANGEMGSVIEKMQKGEQPSAVETRMMGKYIATLADKADKSPTKENLVALRDAIELSDRVGGSDVGKALRARQGDFLPDDSLSGNLVKRMEAAGVTELTEAQKKEVETLTNELKRTKEEAKQKLDELEQKNKELQAELEIANAKKSAKKNEKKDYKKERSDIKQSIKDKWKKAANDGTLTAVPVPYAKQLASIAPDVAKLMKSYVEEGVTTLVELVDRIHGDVKEAIPEVDRKDVFDILAGKYNEPKKTKNELMEQMRDLRDEAKYIAQLETLNAGVEPKSERAKVERNRRVKELQDKIKEHDVTKLSQIKKRNEAQLKELQGKLAKGDFTKKKTTSAIDNLELQKKYPDLYKSTINAIRARENAKHQLDLANLNEEIAAQGKLKTGAGHLARAFRTAKALKAGIDDSGFGVQTLALGLANPRAFASAIKEHALDALSAERFERNLAKLHNSEWWPLIEQSGLSVVDPKSLRESEKNDIYNDTYWDKMQVKLNGKTINLAPTKPFERAFTSLGNNLRVNVFLRRAEYLMSKGTTINNHPEEYKALASVINNFSGRGTMLKEIEVHNDILSAVLWSPRLLASSVNVLGLSDIAMPFAGKKGFYASLTPTQRRYATSQLVKGIGTGVALMTLLSYGLGGDSDLDPTSVTFGTVKVGDYRYTIFGRYNSVVRMIAMSAMAVRKTSKGADDLTDNKGSTINNEGAKFIRGKVNPTVGILWNLWSRKGYDGKPITLTGELKNALLPMSVDDVLKGLSQDGTKSLLIRGIPSFIGVKVSNENDFQQSGGAAPKKKPSKPTPKHKTRD
jgi:hypothetical protein